jgi:hypothetical protein
MSRWLMAALVAVAACSKTEGERAPDIARCSNFSSDALEIQLCLETQFAWKEAEARQAAVTTARGLDSINARRADSAWAAGAAARRVEVRQCAGADQARCLLTRFGWPPERARAAADSVWAMGSPAHRREVLACAGDRQGNVGSCLMLRYKWPPERALATYDSIQRERMR